MIGKVFVVGVVAGEGLQLKSGCVANEKKMEINVDSHCGHLAEAVLPFGVAQLPVPLSDEGAVAMGGVTW